VGPVFSRVRRFGVLLFTLTLLLFGSTASSDPLPAALQADLVIKVASYDRNMRGRAGANVRVLVVARGTDEDQRWSSQIRAALGRSETIAGLPHSELAVTYSKADDLLATQKKEHAAIVVLSASLVDESEAIRAAFDGVDVLTAAPDSEMARRGIVLAFELASGKPKLFLGNRAANRQNVALSAEVLKLMTVFP
jgi:hypothetical protein